MPVRLHALPMISAVLALTLPAAARADETAPVQEAWTATGDMLRAGAAGISAPQQAGGLSLSKSGEASNGGSGIDNYAQYLSQDGAIQATLYIYLPSYADASLAAYMTDKAIMSRFGAKTRRTAYDTVRVGGRDGGAIRAVYEDAADGALTTAAAFVHAGRWLAKIRVTGPAERQREVLAGLDGMLSSLRFDDAASIHSTRAVSYADCADSASARAAGADDLALKPEGGAALCVRSRIETADGSYEMLQAQGVKDGPVIIPADDMGTVLAFDRTASGRGYRLSIHSVGRTDFYGTYARLPGAQQIAAMLNGKDPQIAQASSTADYAANGKVTVRHAQDKAN
ncbi:putative uncharacterized protein precursor [Sphingomonas paucimobilis]|nr:hypothetical protein [Sphingobium quisquiliarum]EZP72513.1 putative uncharacterized protein precursor [Sphingomonas paucimobilis]